jgi:hypothetical protein
VKRKGTMFTLCINKNLTSCCLTLQPRFYECIITSADFIKLNMSLKRKKKFWMPSRGTIEFVVGPKGGNLMAVEGV